MTDRSGIEYRLALTLAVIALAAVAGLLAILPYRLYERDIRHAAVQAHRVSAVVQAALDCPLAAGGDAAELVRRIQGVGDVRIGLARLEAGEMPAGAMAGRGSSVLDDTDLRYVSTPVLDAQGEAWIAEMHFDLSPMKRESLRLVFDLVLAVALGAAVFSAVIFLLFRRALVLPLRALTRRVEMLAAGAPPGEPPRFESREMNDLAQAIERLARR
jgi:hypothetical protein